MSRPATLNWAVLLALLLAGLSLLVIGRVLWLGLPLIGQTWHSDLDVVWKTLGMVGAALLISLIIGTGLAVFSTRARLGVGASKASSSMMSPSYEHGAPDEDSSEQRRRVCDRP